MNIEGGVAIRRAIWIIVVTFLVVGATWGVLRSGPAAQAQQGAGDCPGAQTVNTTTGNSDKLSEPFQTTGDSFRVTTDVTTTAQGPDAGADADVTSQDGQVIDNVGHDGDGSESAIVNAPPGTYVLDIAAESADYTFTVEDCTGDKAGGSTTSGGTTTSGGSTSPSGNTTTPVPPLRPVPNPTPPPPPTTPPPLPPPAPPF